MFFMEILLVPPLVPNLGPGGFLLRFQHLAGGTFSSSGFHLLRQQLFD
jgi:hypothetical protein